MLAFTESAQVAIGLAVITTLVAPTWLGWWNGRTTKHQMKTNGGMENNPTMKDKIDFLVDQVRWNSERLEHMEDRQVKVERKLDGHIRYMNKVHKRKPPVEPRAGRRHTDVTTDPENPGGQ